MRLVLAICISFVGIHAAWAQERSGEAAYSKVCRVCHGPQGRGDLGPALVPMTKDADEVLGIVREGLGEMPPVSTRELTDDQVAQIVEYLKSSSSLVPVSSASRSAAGNNPTQEKDVMATLEIMADATIKKDIATLDKVFHEDLIYSDSSGSTQTKAERLKAVAAGPPIESTKFSDATIRLYGTLALVKCIAHLSERSEHRPNDVDVDVLWVLVKGLQSWQIVARHATRVLP